MANVSIDGLGEILEGLNRLGGRAVQAETKILKESAKIVQKKAKQIANQKNLRSSKDKAHMVDNIAISGIKKGSGRKYILVGPSKGDNSEFFYAKFLEWGTSKMSAKPFMEPALRDSKDEIIERAKLIAREALGV
jgi:HK97 gp10 family phage protein